ncbi:MAG TPA: VanZ family protein [Ardenticatenaceae bacterium]
MRRWLSLWGPPLLLMAIIFFLSGQADIPGPDNLTLDRVFKKGAHALGYGLLAFSYARALAGMGARRVVLLALVLTLLYALSDEWHQTYVPTRNGNLLDVLIDLGGAIVGLLGWQLLQNRGQLDSAP